MLMQKERRLNLFSVADVFHVERQIRTKIKANVYVPWKGLPNKSVFISSYTLLKFSCVYPEAQGLECWQKKKSLFLLYVEVAFAKYVHANLLHSSKERLLVHVALGWRLSDILGRCLIKEEEIINPKTSAVWTKSAFKPFGSITFWLANVIIGVWKALALIHDVERNTDHQQLIHGSKWPLYVIN